MAITHALEAKFVGACIIALTYVQALALPHFMISL